MAAKVTVGIIGCGNIFDQYIKGCRAFEVLDVVACADLDMARAEARAKEYKLQALTVDQLIAHPAIQIVVNLTVPMAHKDVSLRAIAAGKHIYSEKPLAITVADGKEILAAAEAKGVKVGCAPDTFLGGGLQTPIKMIEDGVIGRPIGATAFFATHGPETWHPNPDFFYHTGGGPVLDMAPYYLTALVTMLGGVKRVNGLAKASFPQRTATSKEAYGRKIDVTVPTLAMGTLEFDTGAIASVTFSFDVWTHRHPMLEVYGELGSLSVPDPNRFDGEVQVFSPDIETGKGKWKDIPLTHSDKVGRGIGVADLAYGILSGRPHRASGQLALHVLEVMEKLVDAGQKAVTLDIETRISKPAPLPTKLPAGKLDD